jgi:hypothetical protein
MLCQYWRIQINLNNLGMEEAYRISVGKHEGKRSLEIPKCKWKDDIRMYLREIGWESVDWI